MNLPPYAKQVSRLDGDIWIYFGRDKARAWRCAKARADCNLPALILPSGESPEKYAWPVSGRDVLAVQVGEFPQQDIPRFAKLLIAAGASVVRVVYGNRVPQFVTYQGLNDDRITA